MLRYWSIEISVNLPFLLGISLLTVGSLLLFGVYDFIIRSFSETLILRLGLATIITVLNLYLVTFIAEEMLPRSIPLMYGF